MACAVLGAFLALWGSPPARSQERDTEPLAACPIVADALNATLPARVAGGELVPRSGAQPGVDLFQRRVGEALTAFQTAKTERRDDFIKRFPEGRIAPVDQASALKQDEKDRQHQPALLRYRKAHGRVLDELDLVRRASHRFWTRDYQPRGAEPRRAPGGAPTEALATELAIAVLRTAGKAKAGQGDCRIVREALIEAAAWSLVSLAREQVRRGQRAGIGPHLDAIGSAEKLLGLDGRPCASPRHCVLAAKIALLRLERQGSSASAAGDLEPVQARIDDALRLSAMHGPAPATAEAWMVKAELEPARDSTGPILNPLYVGNAFAARQALTPLQAVQASSLEPLLPNQFRHRLLPIFQAAADATYRRVEAGEASAGDLVAVGEASRRAQIESVLGDACEPLEIPFAPNQLHAGETIVYPVVGTDRSYILTGTSGPDASLRRDAQGWTLVLSKPEGEAGAAEMADHADRLVTRLDLAASEFGGVNIQIGENPLDWGGSDARWLHAQLLAPLAEKQLIRMVALDGDADAPTLIFFPDPALRNVPWALLHSTDSEERRERDYLVRSAAIAVAPALAYVRPLPRPHRRGGLLVGAIADLADFVDDLDSYGLTVRLSGRLKPDDFTRENLLGRLSAGGPSVLLLATHATFDGAASWVAVSPPPNSDSTSYGELRVDEIERSIRQARRRTTGLDLLILVSCEGAAGDAGQLGLAGAALRGGAASTIGPIVRVAADYAPHYFAHSAMGGASEAGKDDAAFLNEYYRGRSPAQALRQTQLASLDPSDWAYGYEANWGVFMVVGNWR